jgi:hypothetical protein
MAAIPPWLLHWEFWLVLAVAAWLRLPAINHAPFMSDDALLFLQVARAQHDHLLPFTGIYSSILTLNLPAYSLIILPFASNPHGAVVLTVLANIAAIALLYITAARYFSRPAALLAGLLLAGAGYDTWMSIFLWQNTLLLPLMLGALYFWCRGVAGRRAFWITPHLILLTLAIQIHPIAASFIPITLLGLLLGLPPLKLRAIFLSRIDLILGIAASFLLLVPTLLFEFASNGAIDGPAYQQWLSAPKHQDGQLFQSLTTALSPLPGDYFGPTAYTSVPAHLAWLAPLLWRLWAIGSLWLALTLLIPILRLPIRLFTPPIRFLIRHLPHTTSATAALPTTTTTSHPTTPRPLGFDATWRARLPLLLWPAILFALTIRHSSPVYPHYVFIITPIAYLTIALFLTEAPIRLTTLLTTILRHYRTHARHIDLPTTTALVSPSLVGKGSGVRSLRTRRALARRAAVRSPSLVGSARRATRLSPSLVGKGSGVRFLPHALPTLCILFALLLAFNQLAATNTWMHVLTSGQAWGWSWGAISDTSYTRALATVNTQAARLHSRQVYIAADPTDPYMGLYWAQRQNNLATTPTAPTWTSYLPGDCYLTPPHGAPDALLLATNTSGLAYQELLHQRGAARLIATLPMARGTSYPVYAIAPDSAPTSRAPLATVNGELRLQSAITAPAANGLPARLITRWTVLTSTPPGPAVAQYHFHLLFFTPSGYTDAWSICQPSIWLAGEGITLVTPLPHRLATQPNWQLGIIVSRDTHSWYQPHIGALQMETSKELLGLDYGVLPLGATPSAILTHPTQSALDHATITLPQPPLQPDP